MSASKEKTHIAKCPYCGQRNAWLAQRLWTCHACAHTWPMYADRRATR